MPYTPNRTGYRRTDTSAGAAIQVEPRTQVLRDAIMQVLRDEGMPMAPDDVATVLREDKLSIRPRFTELKNAGKIRDSGARGKTDMGKSCILWEVVP